MKHSGSFIFLLKTSIVGTYYNRLSEAILTSSNYGFKQK